MSWSTSELRVRLAHRETGLNPPVKYFYWPFQGGTSFADNLCFFSDFCLLCLCVSVYLCLVVTCWESLTSWLPFVVSNCKFITFPLVSWVRCGTWLYQFLIFAALLTLQTRYQGYMLSGFRQEDLFMFSLYESMLNMWPTVRSYLWPKKHNLGKIGKGLLANDTYQIPISLGKEDFSWFM